MTRERETEKERKGWSEMAEREGERRENKRARERERALAREQEKEHTRDREHMRKKFKWACAPDLVAARHLKNVY